LIRETLFRPHVDGNRPLGFDDDEGTVMPREYPEVDDVRMPEGRTTGVYANGLAISFSPLDFTLDFLVGLTGEPVELPDGQRVLIRPQEVVARMRANPSLVWEIARNLTEAMQQYEDRFGMIRNLTDYENTELLNIETEDDNGQNEWIHFHCVKEADESLG